MGSYVIADVLACLLVMLIVSMSDVTRQKLNKASRWFYCQDPF